MYGLPFSDTVDGCSSNPSDTMIQSYTMIILFAQSRVWHFLTQTSTWICVKIIRIFLKLQSSTKWLQHPWAASHLYHTTPPVSIQESNSMGRHLPNSLGDNSRVRYSVCLIALCTIEVEQATNCQLLESIQSNWIGWE